MQEPHDYKITKFTETKKKKTQQQETLNAAAKQDKLHQWTHSAKQVFFCLFLSMKQVVDETRLRFMI